MSSVAISGNASGAGVFTVAAPNSASSFTLTLPVQTGTLVSGANANSVTLPGATSGTLTLSAPAVSGTTTITMPAVSGTMTVLSPTQSMVRLNTDNSFGSTNTAIRRFSNVVTNQGSDITYADSATLGSTFTINTDGVYAITYTMNYGTANWVGLSLNSTSLSTNIQSITITQILTMAIAPAASQSGTAQWTGYLPSGSIVRPHGIVSAASGTAAFTHFTIVKVT